jgi:hypothetical protein
MTHLDEPVWPSCPTCGSNEHVCRDLVGQVHHKPAYLCGQCWTTFAGGADEWARHRDDRERHQHRQEND